MKLILCRLIHGLSWVYLFLLFAWFAAYLITGDRIPYLGLLNLLAVYLFFPLPFVLLPALACGRRDLWAGFGAAVLIFLAQWGPLFLPRLRRPSQAGPVLTVMTFNVLAWHDFTGPIIDTIRADDPDVVMLQELNYGLAQALETELKEVYPYQVLEPAGNPSGIGTLSKVPLRPTGKRPGRGWIGGPIVVEMDWADRAVTLVNFHMLPTTGLYSQQRVRRDFEIRAEQAHLLVDLARPGPAILGGDANAAPNNDTIKILTGPLQDTWWTAGWGLGHTFPGSKIPGSDRPHYRGIYVPPWLSRIDYIFCTSDWEVISARLAKVDGVSDHRGVVAVLSLK